MNATDYYAGSDKGDGKPLGEWEKNEPPKDADCICNDLKSAPCPSAHEGRNKAMWVLWKWTSSKLVECSECEQLFGDQWYLDRHLCKGKK